MQVTNRILNDMDGNALPAGENQSLTLALALMNAALMPQDQNARTNIKSNSEVERFMLAIKLRSMATNESFDLTAEQIVMLKEDLRRMYPPLVSGQCIAILEGLI